MLLRYTILFLFPLSFIYAQNQGAHVNIDDEFAKFNANETHFLVKNKYQKDLIYLKDSSYLYYFDDVVSNCENQPTKVYYQYDMYGHIVERIVKNTPDPGCDPYKRRYISSYENGLLEEGIEQYFDFSQDIWMNDKKRIYSYDTYVQLLTEIIMQWDEATASWENNVLLENIFDENQYIEEKNRYNWDEDTNSWAISSVVLYTYDSYYNQTEYLRKYWNSTSNQWITSNKITSQFDENQNLIERIYYSDIYGNNEWSSINKYVYVFDELNHMIESYTYRNWDNTTNDWEYKNQNIYNNNSYGNPVEILISFYNNTSSTWDLDNKKTLFYNSQQNEVFCLIEVWENSNWTNLSKRYTSYNSNENILEMIEFQWNENNMQWEDDYKITYSYNEDFVLTHYTESVWDGNEWWIFYDKHYEFDDNNNLIHYWGGSWMDYWSDYHYYDLYEISGVSEEISDAIQVFPNPTREIVFIRHPENEKIDRVLLFDSLGKNVLDTNQTKINISFLDNGIYFLRIYIDNYPINYRIIKE